MRKLHALIPLLAVVAALPAAAPASALPRQAMYERCVVGVATAPDGSLADPDDCIGRLRGIRERGFTVILNYRALDGDLAHAEAYADAAAALGMKVIWPLNAFARQPEGIYPWYEAVNERDCGRCTREQLIDFLVRRLKDHPATYQWYVGDEEPFYAAVPDAVRAVSGLAARIRAIDREHPTVYLGNLYPALPADQVAPFAGAVDVLGGDFYPVGATLRPGDSAGPRVTDAGAAADVLQRLARRGSGAYMLALQAYPGLTPGGDLLWPTRWQTATMLASALRHRDRSLPDRRPEYVLWYSFHSMVGVGAEWQVPEDRARLRPMVEGVFGAAHPPDTLAARRRGAVRRWRSNEAGATFECSRGGGPWRRCGSGRRVGRRAPRLLVRAVDHRGTPDRTPLVVSR